jgi:hypothetical protein
MEKYLEVEAGLAVDAYRHVAEKGGLVVVRDYVYVPWSKRVCAGVS